MSKNPVGEIRPSQLLWTYGPGALIDLPNLSVVTMGIDRWELGRCQPIHEARLLSNVRRVLGNQIESLRMPPQTDSDGVDPFSAEALVGVPVKPFPRWMRCVKCGLLSTFDAGLFELRAHRYRPERTCFVHKGCTGSRSDKKSGDADAVPARFLLACREGHLDDFPWQWFVHGGTSGCKGTLRFFESGASLQTENLWVRCDSCSAAKSMAQAFGQSGKDNLPGCRGRHPHLNKFEDGCDEVPRVILLGATNGWFPVTLSVLAIPQMGSPLAQLIADGWTFFEDVESPLEAAAVVKTLRKSAQLPGIEAFTGNQVWESIQAHRSGTVGDEHIDLKGPEWDVLTSPTPPADYPHFMSKKTEVPKGFERHIKRVLLLERLREVNALLGFTRVESPNEGSEKERAPRAPIGRTAPNWVPATQVHGEGIFLQFAEEALADWAKSPEVWIQEGQLRRGHGGWRVRRRLDPETCFPGMRFALLHTIAHLLIREISLDCGYNAASVRERIYADTENGEFQAGILIYTAAADSDGTLGGLVDPRKARESRTDVAPSDRSRKDLRVRSTLRRPQPDERLFAARCVVPRVFIRFGDFVRVRKPLPRSHPRRSDAASKRRSLLLGVLMQALLDAVVGLVALVSPAKVHTVASAFRGLASAEAAPNTIKIAKTPAARAAISRIVAAWRQVHVNGDEVAGMLVGASEVHVRVEREQIVELVWTGPTTLFVPTRRTEQVLIELIASAATELFLVSFVAYNVPSVVIALHDAANRGVRLRILLEASTSHGGSLNYDPAAAMRSQVESAELFYWKEKHEPFVDGKVHAKVAVVDGERAFITSANLTGHALEKNMEAGVLIKSGRVPKTLRDHLEGLITVGVIVPA